MPLSTRRLDIIQMSVAMTMSGTLGYFVLNSGQGAFNVVFFRCLFGALALFAYCQAQGLFGSTGLTGKSLMMAVGAGAALVLNWVLLFSAYRLASISLSTAVYNFQPFFLMALGAIFLGEKPGARKIGWTVVAFCGLLLLLDLGEAGLSLSDGYLPGLVLGMGAGALYAVTAIIVKRLTGVAPQLLALIQAVVGVATLAPMVDYANLPVQASQWGCLVVLGIVHTGLMYILLYSAIQKLPTVLVGALSFIYPAVAIVVDYLFFGQRLHSTQAAGIALILLAVAGVTLNLRWWPGARRRAHHAGAMACRWAPSAQPGRPEPTARRKSVSPAKIR